MQDLARMAVFGVVAEELSLSKAAAKLGYSTSAVSKQITALENHLGIKLLYRGVRRNRLTDEGEMLAKYCQPILRHYQDALDLVEQLKTTASGGLLLDMPGNLANHIVIPRLQAFQQNFPLIKLNIRLSQASFQTLSKDLDIAVVSGQLPESSLICRRLGEQQFRLYASPTYIEQHGEPKTLDEIANHPCIVAQNDFVNDSSSWYFQSDQEPLKIEIESAITVNDMATVEQLVINGMGIAPLQEFAVQQQVAQGALVPLLTDFTIPPVPIYALFPERKHLSPKIRAMVEFLHECFELAGLNGRH